MSDREELRQIKARLDRIETHLGLRPHAFRAKPPFYGLTPASGLHFLKDKWNQVEYMGEQCSWLHDELELALEATRVLAPDRPKRGKKFQLSERLRQARPGNGEERQLEWDLFDKWGPRSNGQDATPDFWQRIVSFQVPLYDNNLHDGWDKIDLVAVSGDGEPVIIELKKGGSQEKPLRPLLEATGYAVALKKVWPAFQRELQEMVDGIDLSIEVNPDPENFRLVILAPGEYWQWLANREIDATAWGQFKTLTENLGQSGFPVSFAQVNPSTREVAGIEDFPPSE